MRRSLRSFVLLGAAAALALAGCSNKDSTQSDGEAAADDEAAANEMADMGPLWSYMSAIWASQDISIEEAQAQDRQREDLIATCMADEGFEYIPDVGDQSYTGGSDYTGPEWGSREFAEQYGFGIVDWPNRFESEESDQGEEWVDPNADYVASLSESEQQAWGEALYGRMPSEEDMVELENGSTGIKFDPEDQGCWEWAADEVAGLGAQSKGFFEDPEFADLSAAMDQVWQDVQEHPDMAALNQEWFACMAQAGYPDVPARVDIAEWAHGRFSELVEPDGPDGKYVEPDAQQLAEFQAFELAAALADWDCADQVDFDARAKKIDFGVQQAFLDAHRDQLDAALARYATASTDDHD